MGRRGILPSDVLVIEATAGPQVVFFVSKECRGARSGLALILVAETARHKGTAEKNKRMLKGIRASVPLRTCPPPPIRILPAQNKVGMESSISDAM